MATALKSLYHSHFFDRFIQKWQSINPEIDSVKFLQTIYCEEWNQMELKARISHICDAVHQQLPKDYPKACKEIISLTKTIAKGENERLEFYFLPQYIESYGLDDFDTSMKAIEVITQYYSCEFAIRPFLDKYPKESLAQMIKWSKHAHHKVRRLSSEGCRPNLPWAKKIQIEPKKVLSILEELKVDDSLFVRKSVANHLNDISKLHPLLFKQLLKDWKGKNIHSDWILKHASRSLLKSADKEVLAAFGYLSPDAIKLKNFQLHRNEVKLGDKIRFSFDLTNESKNTAKLRMEYVVHFLKANGKNAAKVFQIGEKQLKSNEQLSLEKKHSFKPISTRKYYPGKHYISLIVNGEQYNKAAFHLQ